VKVGDLVKLKNSYNTWTEQVRGVIIESVDKVDNFLIEFEVFNILWHDGTVGHPFFRDSDLEVISESR
jgi:hypothetical protein